MQFSVIYSVDVPAGTDVLDYAPPNVGDLWESETSATNGTGNGSERLSSLCSARTDTTLQNRRDARQRLSDPHLEDQRGT